MDHQSLGKMVIGLGVAVVLIGVFVYANGLRLFPFLGKMPGDIRVETEHTRFYFPIVTCIVISVVLSLITFLLSRFR